jgi:hypothetical protein
MAQLLISPEDLLSLSLVVQGNASDAFALLVIVREKGRGQYAKVKY